MLATRFCYSLQISVNLLPLIHNFTSTVHRAKGAILMENNETKTTSPETTSETVEQAEASTPEQDEAIEKTREILQKMSAQGKKPVLFVPPMSAPSRTTIDTGLQQLATLKTKIDTIRTTVNEQNDHINGRLGKLQDNPILKIDGENKQAKESVAQYTDLLDRILEEVKFEEGLLSDYAALEKQTVIPVWFQEPDEFDPYIRFKVNRVKKQVKKIERDLDVSFSRYQFSFDRQCKHLDNVEQFVSYNMQLRDAQAKMKQASEEKEAAEPANTDE
jgi:hypothetical protein